MDNSINEVSLQELQINICLEELNSEEPQTRQYAISQLQNFIDSEIVVNALKTRAQIEENPECKADLDETLKLAAHSETTFNFSENRTGEASELARLWQTVESAQLPELVKHVKKLAPEDQARVVCEVLTQATSSAQIVPILSLSRNVMMRAEVIDHLEKLVTAESSLLVIRVVSLLTRLMPAKLVVHLPGLLLHKNFQVRLMAIKALHLLSKPEAIRLLNELMFSSDSSNRKSAFSFLFVLPFNDTGDIVLRLIERVDLPKNLDQVIRFLIYNNPDQKFFRRITLSYLLHGKKIAALKNYWSLAARSLTVSGLVKKSEQELINETLADTRAFILRHTKHDTDKQETVKKSDASDHKNQELLQLSAVSDFSHEHIEKLLKICENISTTEEITSAVRLIGKNKLASNAFCTWLENLLEKDSPEVINPVVETLLELNKARLLPHLPILVFHKNPAVAEKCLKIFNSGFPEKLVEKLKLWIRDNKAEIREVAHKGLMEIEFLQARELILTFVRNSTSLELIKYYSSILLLNPDRLTVYKLNDLSVKSSGEKRKLLTSLAGEIKEELGESAKDENSSTLNSVISELGIKEQWEDILGRIKQISYDSQPGDIRNLLTSKAFNLALVGFLILSVVIFLVKFQLGGTNKPLTNQAPQEKAIYSYDLGNDQEVSADKKIARPWDYEPPELATPPDSLYEMLTVEERRALHEELKKEAGPSAEEAPRDDQKIRLEVELPR